MAAQNVLVRVDSGALDFSWDVLGEPVAISVQIATDNEFTTNARTFVIPPMSGVRLDVGNGVWFFRIGSWLGTTTQGKITWTPVYGPAILPVRKTAVKAKVPTLPLIHAQGIAEGVRLHTGVHDKSYAIIEYSVNARFPGSKTSSVYMFDWGRGYFDCMGLDPLKTYSVRLSTFSKDRDKLPDESIVQLEAFSAAHGKRPIPASKPMDNTMKAIATGDDPILREALGKPFLRFASHAEYLRFTAAKARSLKDLGTGGVRKP